MALKARIPAAPTRCRELLVRDVDGLLVGFIIAYPMNWWLVAHHLKHGMMTGRRAGDVAPLSAHAAQRSWRACPVFGGASACRAAYGHGRKRPAVAAGAGHGTLSFPALAAGVGRSPCCRERSEEVSPCFSRRAFLSTLAASTTLQANLACFPRTRPRSRARASTAARPRCCNLARRGIEVNGKSASVFGIRRATAPSASGPRGQSASACRGQRDRRAEPHPLHGLTPPWQQEWRARHLRPPIPPGGQRRLRLPAALGGPTDALPLWLCRSR